MWVPIPVLCCVAWLHTKPVPQTRLFSRWRDRKCFDGGTGRFSAPSVSKEPAVCGGRRRSEMKIRLCLLRRVRLPHAVFLPEQLCKRRGGGFTMPSCCSPSCRAGCRACWPGLRHLHPGVRFTLSMRLFHSISVGRRGIARENAERRPSVALPCPGGQDNPPSCWRLRRGTR